MSFSQDFAARFGVLVTEWNNVTIPAGGRVILMRFVSQQTGRSNATATAQRLEQLPPEALIGLSASERSDIINWSVPSDGVGSVAALPPLDGTVQGTVLAGDGATTVPRATVNFVSQLPFYGRTYSTSSLGDGAYSLGASLTADNNTQLIPRGGFLVNAIEPNTGENSGDNAGVFGNSVEAVQNIVFGSTGLLSGTVRRTTGEVVSAAGIEVTGANLLRTLSLNTATDAVSYTHLTLPTKA